VHTIDLNQHGDDLGNVIRDMTAGCGTDSVIDAVGMEAHGSPVAKIAHRASTGRGRQTDDAKAGVDIQLRPATLTRVSGTLVGPGGVGKTRLALEAAARRVDRYSHGVHFVPLVSVASLHPDIVKAMQARLDRASAKYAPFRTAP